MTFGQNRRKNICSMCGQEKTAQQGQLGGYGWGSERKPGTVYVCHNPKCQIGHINSQDRQAKTGS